MERDEESGLSYHGARYYATWLGRWTSCDPTGPADGPNLYEYARCCPVRLTDPGGTDSKTDSEDIWPHFDKSWKPPPGGKKSDPEGERLWARQEELRKKYAGDLPRYKLRTDNSDPVLTPMIRDVISARADALTKLMSKWDAEGKTEDANLLMHIIGDLMLDVRLGEKQWNDLSDSAQNYWHMKLDHPEWAVPGNAFTGAIVDESMSLDVNFVQGTIVGYMGHSVTSTPTPSKPFSPTAPRAALPDSSVRINGEGFGIADGEGVMAHQTMNRWYSRWIQGGTRLILSRGPVNQNGIWNALTRFARSGRRATIIAGVHGDEAGRILRQTPEEIDLEGDMWRTDMEAFGRRPGIRLLRADQLSDFELDQVLTSGDDVYAGWCHSGVCSQLVRAFNRVNNIQ